MRLTRREFLKSGGTATLVLSLESLVPFACGREPSAQRDVVTPTAAPQATPQTLAGPEYRSWEDVYRAQWVWDHVGRSSHFVNCWYQAHCAWSVYVKDGLVWREEQAADYPRVRADVPDFNPRGCQKGACYSERMYGPTRVKYPLKRVGERGSGQWKRLTWDEALTEIADLMIDTIAKEGPERIIWSLGPLYTFGPHSAGQARLSFRLDNCSLDMNTEIGDGHPGAAVTFGKIIAERSADDYFFSDVILIWGCNPVNTQIPNAHFFMEARYKGARVITISPDYNPSAVHADEWIPINPGTDAALALSLVQVIVGDGLHDQNFLREQTDMPFLVRDDTGRFLRESDMEKTGSPDVLYIYDEISRRVQKARRDTLALNGIRPALEGSFQVRTVDGAVTVRPVFELLRAQLDRHYKPEQTATVTGVSPAVARRLAHTIARARTAANVTSSNIGKYYHGNLIERAQILLLAVCGHMGKKGAGFSAFPFLVQDGFDLFALMRRTGLLGRARVLWDVWPVLREVQRPGMHEEEVRYAMGTLEFQRGMLVSGVMFWNIHGGLLELADRLHEWDPYLKRPLRAYVQEALDKQYQYVWPKPGDAPRIVIEMGSNIMRRLRGHQVVLKHLFPKLSAFVTLDWRMSSTARLSDYVLPVTGWYEKAEHKWGTPLMPFIHAGTKLTGFHEAKSDWEICGLLARKIQQRARERGITTYKDRHGEERRLDTVYDDFTMSGTFTENDEEKVAEELVKLSTNLEGVDWATLREKGYARFTSPGLSPVSIGNRCEIKPDDTVSPFTDHVQKKEPYPTLTGRIQFYIDHPYYAELGERLPVHKDPLPAGGRYPLILTGAHTRWSIHSAWRDDALMQRLERGSPCVWLSVEDAKARGVEDGILIEVRNDINSFRAYAKVSPAIRPGQVLTYHAWEDYQFPGGKGFQSLIPSPINPVDLAGGEGHLRPIQIALQPTQNDRDTRVEVTPVKA